MDIYGEENMKTVRGINGCRISSLANSSLLRRSLCTFGLCGLAGVLVDVDHPISYYFAQGSNQHFLHIPLFLIGCLVLLGLSAYLRRLLYKGILR